MKLKIPRISQVMLVSSLFASQCLAAQPCQSDGAFGLRFGSTVPAGAKRISNESASTWYAMMPTDADTRFDSYQVRVNSEDSEIFEIVAKKVITPMPALSEPPLSAEKRQAGVAQAKAFALQYIAELPENMRSRVIQNKYGTANWTIQISDSVEMSISAGFAWDVTVSCKDFRREWSMARRVMPELFERKAR